MHRPITALPVIYVHGGVNYLTGDDPGLDRLRPAPPTILHISPMETPLPCSAGAAFPKGSDTAAIASPEEVAQRLEKARKLVSMLHEAGVRWVIPYICNQTVSGNPETRLGIWKFYDHWDEYTRFGIGPRPEADPIDWLARERDGDLHFNYEKRHSAFTPMGQFRYALCMNNPHYNQYQRAVVRMIAMSGYDGVFVDNNNLNCYCTWCEKSFREWMTGRHTPRQLREKFGWSSPEEIHLGYRGSRFAWLKEDPLFRVFVAETLSPEERIRWFGTDDMERAHIAEAGNGWLWGRGNEYRRWVCARLSPEARERQWGGCSFDDWGIAGPADRLLWAETKRFWGDSVRVNLGRIRRWGAEVLGRDFLIVPNWGNMQQYEDLKFREEIGHVVRQWAPETDYLFWEDDSDPGRVVPGVYLDFAFSYKFAFAHGVRSACMAALPDDAATCALAHAEAAATGGSAFIQRLAQFPEIRGAYNRLFADYAEWFEGYTSAAKVGLACCLDDVHLENGEHVRLVNRVSHYLNAQQVPFDFLLEEHLADEAYLSGYRVAIIPAVRYMSDRQCRALASFMRKGGTLVLIGEVGTHDTDARPRTKSPLAKLVERAGMRGQVGVLDDGGRLICAPAIEALLPTGHLTKEDMYEIAVSIGRTTQRKFSRYDLVRAVDYPVAVERFLESGRLGELVQGWGSLQVSDPYAACGVRVFPYVRLGNASGALVAHLVNYNVALGLPAGKRRQEVLNGVAVRLEAPEGWHVRRAEWLVPGGKPEALPYDGEKGAITVRVATLGTYGVARLSLARSRESPGRTGFVVSD